MNKITILRNLLLWGGLLAVLGVMNFKIFQKEKVMETGRSVLLEVGPRDPRSLMQGDYMVLTYRLALDLERKYKLGFQSFLSRDKEEQNVSNPHIPKNGFLVLALDKDNVAKFVRLKTPDESVAQLKPEEIFLRYRVRKKRIYLGARDFFFQEGHGKIYQNARYGELKVATDGDSVLIGLRGPKKQKLEPPPKSPDN